jgi:Protein tyrosine/serine phosphatase
VLFHCSAGKDRTGWLSALLLGVLGVNRAAILDDYLLTNGVTARDVDKVLEILETRRGLPPELIRPVLSALPAYLDVAYAEVEAGWGTFDRYLREGLGLDDGELDALRTRLLT